MRNYFKLLIITYLEHITIGKVRKQIRNATGVHDDTLTMPSPCPHHGGQNSRSSCMTNAVLQDKVEGTHKWTRRKGRLKKRWEDNIKDWPGHEEIRRSFIRVKLFKPPHPLVVFLRGRGCPLLQIFFDLAPRVSDVAFLLSFCCLGKGCIVIMAFPGFQNNGKNRIRKFYQTYLTLKALSNTYSRGHSVSYY